MPNWLRALQRHLLGPTTKPTQYWRNGGPKLHVENLEGRAMPTVVPTVGPHGLALVLVDTLKVDLRSESGMQSKPLFVAGQTYIAVASGEAKIDTSAAFTADAEFIRYNRPEGGSDVALIDPTVNEGIRLNGAVRADSYASTTPRIPGDNLWGGY